MRVISLVVLLATVAHSQTPPTAAAPAQCNAKARWRLYFDHVEVIKLAQTLADMTCKPVVIGPAVEKAAVSIISPESKTDYSSAEAFKVIAVAAEVAGVSIVEKDGVVRVTQLKK
jgi:type II secretory pathway component GspD/PulD (secretin)